MIEALYEVPVVKDLKEMLNHSLKEYGDRNAFMLKQNEQYVGVTYNEFVEDINALGTSMLNMGFRDAHIAIIGENRYEWCVGYLSTVCGVGAIVPLDKELPLNEIENLLTVSKSKALIFSDKLISSIKEIKEKLPEIKYICMSDESGEFIDYRKLIDEGKNLIKSGNREYLDAKIDENVMNILLFTSGTTGYAKGVMLSHKNICSDIIATRKTVYVSPDDRVLSILPLHHTYECTIGFLIMIYSGSSISFAEGLRHISKNIKEFNPSILVVVPLLLENMYKKIWEQAEKNKIVGKVKFAIFLSKMMKIIFGMDLRKKFFKQIHDNFGGRLRLVISGAAALEPSVSKGLYNFGIKVLQGYGLTECAPLVIGNSDRVLKHGSVGVPLPGDEAKILNPDKHGIGEIIVRGPNLMLGYYENKEATDKVIIDGWFHTGDLGYKDKKGFYYITGRIKNVIVTKNGKNIFPEEVESYINKSPYVQESMVWGDYDEESGETFVNVQIVPDFEAIKEKFKMPHISMEEIQKIMADVVKSVNKNMPLYKRIKNFSIRDSEFIKTTSKKIKRYLEQNKKGGN